MAKTISWKPKATQQYREVIQYLKVEFSESTAEKFVHKVTEKTELLTQYPESGQATRYKTIRRKKIGRYNYLYYRISGTIIIILFIWDGRMNPEKNPYSK